MNNLNKVLKKLFYINKLTILILCLSCFNTFAAEKSNSSWYVLANMYVDINEYLISTDELIKKSSEQLSLESDKIIELMNESKKQFSESKPPTLKQLENLFDSELEEDVITACIAVQLSGLFSDKIITKLVDNIQFMKTYDMKFHCISALKELVDKDFKTINKHGNSFIKDLNIEEDEYILIDKLIILSKIKFMSDKGNLVLQDIIQKSDNVLVKILSFTLLNKYFPNSAQKLLEMIHASGNYDDFVLLKSRGKGKHKLLYYQKEIRSKEIQDNEKYDSPYCIFTFFDMISTSF